MGFHIAWDGPQIYMQIFALAFAVWLIARVIR